jgi:hypothetical protein
MYNLLYVEHRFGECPRKIEIKNMFKTKPIHFNTTITPKLLKANNVSVNVVVVVITYSQQPKQHVLKERVLVKAKGAEIW